MAFPEISRMFRRVISVRATRMAEQRTQIAAESRVKHVYKSAPVSPQQRSTKLFGNALESKDLGTAISLFRHVSHIVPFGDRMALFSLALQAPEMTTEIQVVLTSLLDGFLKTSDERQHIPTAYINGFTKSLAGKRNMTDTLAMVTKLLQHDCRVDIETLNSLLKLFAENGMHVQALQFIVSARANQMKVDIHSWCHLIAAFGNAGQPWDALHALKQAEESGIALNSQIMDSCLTAFAKSGQVKGIKIAQGANCFI